MFKVQNKNFGKVGNLSAVSNKGIEVWHLFKVNIRDTIKSVCNLFKVSNRDVRTVCAICSKLTIKMPEQYVQFVQS